MRIRPALAIVLTLLAAGCGGASAPRLPPPPPDGNTVLDRGVVPLAHHLRLRIDPAAAVLKGTMRMPAQVYLETDTVRLHAERVTVERASVIVGTRTLTPQVISGPHGGLALFVGEVLGAGPIELSLDFTAPLEEVPEGIYRVRDGEPAEWYAFSQFEPLEARRAFPCFDQPDHKAAWHVTVEAPKGQLAFSNAPLSWKEPVDGGTFVAHHFQPTPPLPSYLLAFAVGPLETADASPALGLSTPTRVVTTRGKARLAAHALNETARALAELERYFGEPYPYAKLDLVAVPNFAAGAMENPGLITFRERLLLLADNPSIGERQGTLSVIAHELAHIWFGDLVTPRWWDDLWLNEAFATWMGGRVIAALEPRWETDPAQAQGAGGLMGADSTPSQRAIRQPIVDGGDVYNAFDGMTYGKGAAVLGMLESYLEPEVFRTGIRAYLAAHAHRNADTSDLYAALSKAASRDVGALASTFVDRPGVPIVTVALTCAEGPEPARITLQQARYTPLDVTLEPGQWQVPVCLRYATPLTPEPQRQCFLLDAPERQFSLFAPGCPTWLHPNADERGYYRWALPDDALRALVTTHRAQLTLRERAALPGHLSAGMDAGRLEARAWADLLVALGADDHRLVVSAVAGGLRRIYGLLGEKPRPALSALAVRLLGPHVGRLGFAPRDGEPESDRILRGQLVGTYAELTEDPALLAHARGVADRFLSDPAAVDAESVAMYLTLATSRGDEALHTALREALPKLALPIHREHVVRALGAFRAPDLLARSLELVLDPSLRSQDLRTLLGGMGGTESTRRAAWDFVKARYEALVARIGEKAAPGLPWYGSGFCTAEERLEVATFFSEARRMPQGSQRNLELTLQAIDRCKAARQRHAGGLEQWLEATTP